MKLFEVKLPFDFELFFFFQTNDMYETERKYHFIFNSQRVNGEWFAITPSDVTWVRINFLLVQSQYSLLRKALVGGYGLNTIERLEGLSPVQMAALRRMKRRSLASDELTPAYATIWRDVA
jgi:hypothetical protein